MKKNNELPSVKEFIEATRKARHDSWGIGNDPEWPGNKTLW